MPEVHADRAPPTLPSPSVISFLIEKFSIPAHNGAQFERQLVGVWQEAWRAVGVHYTWPRSSGIVAELERARAAAPEDLLVVRQTRNPEAEVAADLIGIVSGMDFEDWVLGRSVEDGHAEVERAKALARSHYSHKGRTPGTRNNPAFDGFVGQLYRYVMICGGSPGTRSKKGADATTGQFFRVLVVLEISGGLPPDLFRVSENARLRAFKEAERKWLEFSNTRSVSVSAPPD